MTSKTTSKGQFFVKKWTKNVEYNSLIYRFIS